MFIPPKHTGIHPIKPGILAQETHREADSTPQMRSWGFFQLPTQGFSAFHLVLCRSTTAHRFCSTCQTLCTSMVSLHVHRTGLMLSENLGLTAHIDCTLKAVKVLSQFWSLGFMATWSGLFPVCKYRKCPNAT